MELDQQNKKEEVVPHNKVIEITDLPQLLKLIEKSPAVVVDFWATWAPACVAFKQVLEEQAAKNVNSNLIFCSVNVDQAEDAAAHFALAAIP